MNFDCGIYSITSPSGKVYIGQAQSIKYRWREHRKELRAGRHRNQPLQRAFFKFGEENLIFAKIAIVPVDQLTVREQEQIDAYVNAGERHMLYNTALCAEASARGLKRNSQTRARIAAAKTGSKNHNFGKKFSPEHRAKIAASNLGQKRSEKTIVAIIASRLGKPLSTTARAKLSLATSKERNPNWGKKASPETLLKMSKVQLGANSSVKRAIVCVEKDFEFITSIAAIEWVRANGRPTAVPSGICKACSGIQRSAYGYTWRYADSYSGEERKLFTTPASPVTLDTAFCAAVPTAVAVLDQNDAPAAVGADTGAPDASFDIRPLSADMACC